MSADPKVSTHAENFAAFMRMQDAEAYLAACQAAAEKDPEDVDARLHLAQAIGHCGKYDIRLTLLRQLVADHPNHDQPNLALGMELMSRGRYREAWPFYAYRDLRGQKQSKTRLPRRLEWQGQPLANATLLVRREQGLGDTLHFARYVIDAQRLGATTLLDAQGALRPLLSSSPALGRVLREGEAVTPQYWTHMLNLMPELTPTLSDVSWPGAYIAPPADAGIHADLGAVPGLRIGLAWSGSPNFAMNAVRSMPLAALAPLRDVTGCRFYSLMPDAGAEIAAAGAEGWLTDLAPVTHPFERLAAVVARMDVVVSTCTSIAHLAGAMGKPTFLMLAKLGEWRWGRTGTTTPWYPSMRLFRQSKLGDWRPVVDDVAEALAAL